MELDNEDVLLGMTIASIILGIGLSMFFIYPYTGYGAVVLAIGMMTLALMITARTRVIERVKREIVLQPTQQAEPTPITPPALVIPSPEPSAQVSVESQSEQAPTTTVTEPTQTEEAPPPPPQEVQPEETQTVESTQPEPQPQPQPEEKAPEKKEEELTAPVPT